MIKLNKTEMVNIEVDAKTFKSMMFYIQRGGSKTALGDVDARNARKLWEELNELEKSK